MLMIPLIVAAFFKTYISKFPNFDANYDKLIHVHAFLASTWVILLIVQPFLVINKKIAAHRLLGKLSYFILPLLVLSFVPGIIKLYNAGQYRFIFYPAADSIVLTILYGMAIYNKKKAPRHMRFMISSSLTLLGPTIGRIFPIWFGAGDVGTQTILYAITFGILLSLVMYDKKNHRKYQPYLVATALFIIHAAIFYILFL
jgi:hypothetical protein